MYPRRCQVIFGNAFLKNFSSTQLPDVEPVSLSLFQSSCLFRVPAASSRVTAVSLKTAIKRLSRTVMRVMWRSDPSSPPIKATDLDQPHHKDVILTAIQVDFPCQYTLCIDEPGNVRVVARRDVFCRAGRACPSDFWTLSTWRHLVGGRPTLLTSLQFRATPDAPTAVHVASQPHVVRRSWLQRLLVSELVLA